MFDLPPPAAESQPDESATEAAEAALAAEIALALESGDVAADAPDSRTKLRVDVSWPARMRLADGNVIELLVRNISETGVGLTSDEHVPARTVVNFEMEVPSLVEGGRVALVEGTIKTTYSDVHGAKILFGGLRNENNPVDNPAQMKFPLTNGLTTTYALGPKPYIEASVGICNILTIFRLDLVKRFTYLDHPNISGLGLRISTNFNF